MPGRRRFLAVVAGTSAAGTLVPATAAATTETTAGVTATRPTATTDWTATYEGDGVDAVVVEGDSYVAAGTTFRIDDGDRVWLLPVAADGTAGETVVFDDLADSYATDVLVTGDRRLVVGTESGGTPARPWVVARTDGARDWTYRPTVESGADYRSVVAVPTGDGDGVALVVNRSTTVVGDADGPRFGLVTELSPAGERRRRRRVGGGESGVDAPLALEDATPTGDGGLLLAGTVGASGERAAWFGAIDDDGLRWRRRVDAVDGTTASAATACERVGDGYLVGVRATPSVASADPFVLRVGPEGETRWRYDATGEGGPSGFAVTDAAVVTGGAAPIQGVRPEFWLAWLDREGDELWAETYSNEGSVADLVPDGDGVIVGGSRTGTAELRRLSLRESSGGDGNGDGEGTTSDPDEETGGGDGSDGGADGSGGGGSGDDADGDGEANDGALGLPGFGTGAAIVGTLGATEYLRRRD
jgi:hypothetical protein